MNIACVGTGWYPQDSGGLEKYVYGMTQALLDSGDSVDLFVTGKPELKTANAGAYAIGQPDDPLWKRMIAARQTFARTMRRQYDVINLHFALNALPLIPFIKHRVPRVIHFHGPWAEESRAEGAGALSVSIKAMLERFIYHRADRFIVLSTAFKEILAGYGVDRSLIHVIPMGIDCDFFVAEQDRRRVRAELGWPDDATVFFTARRLVQRVGLLELLLATQLLREAQPRFMLKIAGKGPLAAELQERIISLGLADCVELLGFVSEDNLRRAYQAADVTLLPSQSLEGFGTIISESLACGTPVIVTPIGGMPDAVSPLSNDLLTQSARPEHIAERMDAVLRGTLALPDPATCRAYAVKSFAWPVVVQRVRSVFAQPS